MADFLLSDTWIRWRTSPILRPMYIKVSIHPIWLGLLDKQLSGRARNAIFRGLWQSRTLEAMSYEQFLIELAKPGGGVFGTLRNVGKATVHELRSVCFDDSLPKYGYA